MTRGRWRRRIDRVIDGDQLVIHLQPILRLTDRAIVGHEALARFPPVSSRRWWCPWKVDTTIMGPDVWFAQAARVGRTVDLEIAAVTAALRRLDILSEKTYLAVNVSAPTLITESFVLAVLQRLNDCVVVELTERDAVANYDVLRAHLDRIRRRRAREGIRLGIDDVGSGVSNFSHILELRPDLIKLDLAIIRGIDGDSWRQGLVRLLVRWAAEQTIDLVAEGIETEEEASMLQSLGVSHGQGYHLGRPAAAPAAP